MMVMGLVLVTSEYIHISRLTSLLVYFEYTKDLKKAGLDGTR